MWGGTDNEGQSFILNEEKKGHDSSNEKRLDKVIDKTSLHSNKSFWM